MQNNNNEKTNLEIDIMSKIRSGKVKFRSKYIFLAEKLGLESAFLLSAVLSVLFSSLFFFYLKATDNLEYLSFGGDGVYAFFESFPYLLVIALIIFLLASGYIFSKMDISYRKSFKYFAASFIVFTVLSGGVLAYTEIPERMETEAFNERSSGAIIRPFLKSGIEIRRSGLSGRILETGDSYMVIETPAGYQKVNMAMADLEGNLFSNGQYVVILGKRGEDDFEARRIKIASDSGMHMIRRCVHRNSMQKPDDEWDNGFIMRHIELKKCMDGCLLLISEVRKKCFDDCLKQ